MPREVQTDYNELKQFIQSYTLADTLMKADFKLNLSSQHKIYYALLIFSAELKYQNFDPVEFSNSKHDKLKENFYIFLSESISEIGSALFIWIHGCYKVSNQTLRSSIENFFKGIGSIEFDEITEKKNTYEVISIAGQLSFFKKDDNHRFFDALKAQYGELCAFVHTADFQSMQNISSIGYFPHFSKDDAEQVVKRMIQIAKLFASVLSLMFPDVLNNMHYKNRDNFLSILDKKIKQKLI